jgi:hypothetical protein
MAVQSRVALLCAALVSSSCFSPGDGIEPPLDRIYFPVGLALNVPETSGAAAPNATRLFVANSNFDLQFNGGTLQSYDLKLLRARICPASGDCTDRCGDGIPCTCASVADPLAPPWCIPDTEEYEFPCGKFGRISPANQKNVPGVCGFVDPSDPQDGGDALVVAKVEIGAFATDLIYRELANGQGRLFAPVRGDATLHWLDVDSDGLIDCGQQGNDGECDDYHRVGDDPDEENTRDLRMPTEPFGIAATPDASRILVTHQTEGKVSLLIPDLARADQAPRLEFVQEGLPSRAMGIAAVPRPRIAAGNDRYEDAFLVTYRNAAQVDQLRVTPELPSASPARPYLWRSGGARITTNSLGYDSRGIALDATERQACEATCGDGDAACLQNCAGIPLGVYVANRTPETLIIGKTNSARNLTSSGDLPVFTDTMDLSVGPSHVVVGQIIDLQGKLATRVFVVCFDSRLIFGYDPVSGRIDTRIWTGRGPHSFVVDVDRQSAEPGYALGYVGHFTDSYIGVIDLDQRRPSYGSIVLTLGRPQAPRAQK